MIAVTIAPLGSAASRSGVTFPDGVGAALWGAADIRSVSIADDGRGRLTLALDLANRPKRLRRDDFVHIFFDADESLLTGIEGYDYAIQADGESELAGLFRWDGKRWEELGGTTLGASASGEQLWLSARDLDGTRRLRVLVETLLHSDPDATDTLGPVPFAFSPPQPIAPELRVVSISSQPSPPRAGKGVFVGVVVERADTDEVVTHGSIRCSARIGPKALRTASQPYFFENLGDAFFGEQSEAICNWNIPHRARGRTISGSVTIVADGLQVSQPFAFRIR